MLSNPPYGKSWKTDEERLGGKKGITDSRFVISFKGEPDYKLLPSVRDGQMLFLANNIAKMKQNTKLGSRIAEVHNGSSLFTGDAGQGESNLRRYIIESDYLEAIIALPENMFYNTGISTYIWILSNRKEDRRKGKVQLIDATNLKSHLRKNLGKKNCEITPEIREQIMDIFLKFEENENSKIFNNEDFGYYKVTIERPMVDNDGKVITDKKGKPKADKDLRDTEQVPLTYEGGIEKFLSEEIIPIYPDAWIDKNKIQIGYEISFTKHFYKPVELRKINDIISDIKKLEDESDGILSEIIGG